MCECETHTIEHLEKIKLETETQKMYQSLSHESQKSEPDASLEVMHGTGAFGQTQLRVGNGALK